MAELPDPESWGIAPGHHHVNGTWVPSPEKGVRAALDAMGADEWAPPPTSTWVISRNWGLHVPFEASLNTEDGGSERVSGHVPREGLPLGYHWLEPADGSEPIRLIVSPGVCPLPRRTWGWAVQLYAARSEASWGIGDLADLRRIAGWSRSPLGGGMVLINPLHAVAPNEGRQQPSPYFPASRRWRNPIYLRIEEVPGAAGLPALDSLAAAGRALNAGRGIDRNEVWRLKRAGLARIWTAAPPGDDFERWRAGEGDTLHLFATWSALAEELGPDWREWPAEYRRPDGPMVTKWAAANAEAVRFHEWLQWLLDGQWRQAAAGPAVVTDLAIGCDPGGADAWQWQDVLASDVTVGAPPDEFSPNGQDWGLPPFDPWRLRAAAYEPFAQIVRSAVAGGGGVRVDHAAGLFRLFWVPRSGDGPRDGVYVRYPWEDLLNVLALELDRAGAFAVGEDLGTVEPAAREALRDRHVLSYRLLWFEDRPPQEWPELALAAATTHDLPTIAGVRTGTDLAARRERGLTIDEDAERGLRARLDSVAGEGEEAVPKVYEQLSSSPCLLVTATLDDALEVTERPNMPGTVDEWPNWSIALPSSLEEIEADRRVRRLADVLGAHRGRQA